MHAKKAKLCTWTPFSHSRRECKGVLLKPVELASERTLFYPLMTHCYLDLAASLQSLLLDSNFSSECVWCKNRVGLMSA